MAKHITSRLSDKLRGEIDLHLDTFFGIEIRIPPNRQQIIDAAYYFTTLMQDVHDIPEHLASTYLQYLLDEDEGRDYLLQRFRIRLEEDGCYNFID